jgi:hypothetical protein
MHDSTALPNLQLLSTSSLVPHEDPDPRRVESISRRLLEEGVLKNPPIVAAIPDTDRYVVLDGANRTMAFSNVGINHIVAQVVSYDDPGVVLDTWYHVVAGISLDDLTTGIAAIDGLILCPGSQEEARQALRERQAVAYFMSDYGVQMISPAKEPIYNNRAEMLGYIVNVYKGRADIIRASNDIWEIQKPCYPDIAALVVFPPLDPQDILLVAKNGGKVPSGITRHIISARAININIPIGILMSEWSLKRKKEWLEEWWQERLSANAIRFYAETTFSFNE